MSTEELETGIELTLDNPEYYVAILTPFGKNFDLIGDTPNYTLSDIDTFVFPEETEETLEGQVKTLEKLRILERVDGVETTRVYGPTYALKDEDHRADAYLCWRAIKDNYHGRPDRFLESPEEGLEELEGDLSFF